MVELPKLNNMQNKILNLIEPTLYSKTGHGYTYVHCLQSANSEFNCDLRVWIDQRGTPLAENLNCNIIPYFSRKFRQLQKIFLYRKLLKQPEVLLISTAELWDLQIIDFFIKFANPQCKVFLHFHQFKQKSKKLATLKKIAAKNHNIMIICPTDRLTKIFTDTGFENCQVVPCPTYTPASSTKNLARFDKVLYAGAARKDKGFPSVINYLQYCRKHGNDTTFEIQISAPNSQRYDIETEFALSELQSINKENLILHSHTLDETQYQQQFNNAISLLMYDPHDYRDKFSAVALDAFYAGSPIITIKNTWMGDMAEKYQAGIALEENTPEAVQAAVDQIKQDFAQFHENAKKAARELSELHDPRNTLRLLLA